MKGLLKLLRHGTSLSEANEEAVHMLRAAQGMFIDAVLALKGGDVETDIRARDKELGQYEQALRRKIITHMSIADKPDINMGLVLTVILIDIERIGDFAKNIAQLAEIVDGSFEALELEEEIATLEQSVRSMFDDTLVAMEDGDEERARAVMAVYTGLSKPLDALLLSVCRSEYLEGRSGHAASLALYLRYLKRTAAHLKNVATSIVNPYERIGFGKAGAPGTEAQ